MVSWTVSPGVSPLFPVPFLTTPMQISVKFFARAKDLAGTGGVSLNLPDGCTVEQAKAALVSLYPDLQSVMSTLLVAVDGEYAADATPLTKDCELACFPPVSGG